MESGAERIPLRVWRIESSIELSAAICNPDVASTDKLAGYIGEAENCDGFNKFWTPHEEHHLAYATIVAGKAIVICVRIFDTYAAAVVVSHDPSRYVRGIIDQTKLRFLAIDSVSGRTINTTFDEEFRRIVTAMRHTATRLLSRTPGMMWEAAAGFC